ncbi:AhpC/TSA family protein [Plesiocystis pacifica]|nr:AhpC/TSA family protein [Plesiocystis pacifica]
MLELGSLAPSALLDARVRTQDGREVSLRSTFEPDPEAGAESRTWGREGVASSATAKVDRDCENFTVPELGPALLLFLRHYACVGCSRQVEELSPRVLELSALGVRAVFIGSGDAEQMAAFAQRHALTDKAVVMVCDPALGSYAAADMRRSLWSAVEPRAWWYQLVAIMDGFRPGRGLQGEVTQQGGAVLLDHEGRVAWLYRARYTADNVDGSELVAAALAMRVVRHKRAGGFVL